MKSNHTNRFTVAALMLALLGGGRAFAQDAAKPTPVLRVLRPVANAVVRENVSVRVAPGDIPSDGYVGITIDNVFRTARVIPDSGRKSGIIFDWDTKAAYSTSDDPDTKKYYGDGDHTLRVDMYDRSGNVLGEATIPVRVANKIIVPAQGIKLSYHWSPSLQLRYLHRSELDTLPSTSGSGQAPQNVEAALIRFSRSVEDTSGGSYLVRDTVLPNSFLVSRGQTQRLETAFRIKSKYRTVDTRGDVLRESAPLSPGQHIGFSIPVLPARKVAVGDSWQAPVRVSLDWAGTQTARVTAESRLEGFEWQNGYPSAKIRETYSGPMTFKTTTDRTMAVQTPAAQMVNSFDAQTVKYERVIFLAYNSGRLVHTETSIDITADLSPTAISALGLNGGAGGGPGANPMANAYGNLLNGDPEGPPAPGEPGYGVPSGPPPGYGPNTPPPGYGGPPPGYGGGYPGGYPGAMGPGFPGQNGGGTPQSTATKLRVTDVTNLIPVA